MTRLRIDEDRKHQIRAAAMRCFVQRGYEATRLMDIAREAGLSKGGVYFHYRSKEALFLDLLDRLAVASSQRCSFGGIGEQPPQRMLRQMLISHVRRLLDVPDEVRLFSLLIAMAGQETMFKERIQAVVQVAVDAYAEVIARGIAEGVFVGGDPVRAALAVVSHIHGLSALLVLGTPGAGFSPDELADQVLRMLAPRSASSIEFGPQDAN